ncbi:MAG TPA: hypothetical protein PLC53_03310 [Bacilli bacterium]|nr:hypothetical protein [Bacilli bacterium]
MINNIDNNIELLHSVVSNLGHNTRLITVTLKYNKATSKFCSISKNILAIDYIIANFSQDDDYNSYYESLYKLIESDISNDVKLWINKLNN